jgi:hypothetical protein
MIYFLNNRLNIHGADSSEFAPTIWNFFWGGGSKDLKYEEIRKILIKNKIIFKINCLSILSRKTIRKYILERRKWWKMFWLLPLGKITLVLLKQGKGSVRKRYGWRQLWVWRISTFIFVLTIWRCWQHLGVCSARMMGWLMNEELEKMWMEEVVASFKILPWH